MKTITKFFLVIASLFIIVGLGISIYVMNTYGWDFTKLNTTQYNKVIYEINGIFNSIEIDCKTIDINIKPANEENCRVEAYESDKVKYDVQIKDNKLTIKEIDERVLLDYMGINISETSLTLFVPNEKYESLDINLTTGDIELFDLLVNNININLTTGDIKLFDSSFENVAVKFTTGDVELTNIKCNDINIKGNNGDVTLNNVISLNEITIHTTTGDVELNKCDASYIKIDTTTGDIDCILLSNKNFIVNTTSGDYDIPPSSGENICELNTTTGDIYVVLG